MLLRKCNAFFDELEKRAAIFCEGTDPWWYRTTTYPHTYVLLYELKKSCLSKRGTSELFREDS
jgi:hypothetical protein